MKHINAKSTFGSRVSDRPVRPGINRSVFGSSPRGWLLKVRWNYLPALLLAAIAGYLLSACSLAPGRNPPVPDSVAELPDEYAGSEIEGAYAPLEWWKSFADPVLDQVIEGVMISNFDLDEAVARVNQARARERIAKAPALPNAGIGAQLDELGLGSDPEGASGIVLPDRLGLTTYNASAEFAYELDFWGRNRNDAYAAGAERLASEWDYLNARMGVLAETVRTYLEIASLRRQQRLAEEIVEIFQQLESLSESRYDRGLIDARGLRLARRALQDAQARLPQVESLRADAEGRLWVLMGGHRQQIADLLPDSLTASSALQPVPAGIPVDLLEQRPDVGAAWQRLEAARYSVGARRADLLPRLSLQGSIGLQSTDSGEWFDPDQWFRNLSLNLLAPVFQGGRLRGNVALAEARLNEAAAAFGRSVVTAVNEVETALAGLEASRRRHSLLASIAQEAKAESDLQELRYAAGVGGYEDFLKASQSSLSAQSVLAAANRDLGFARLALHRALGGSWTADDRGAIRQVGVPQAAPPRFLPTSTV